MTAAVPSLRQQLSQAVQKSLTRHMLSPYEATAVSVTDDLLQFFEAWGDARVAAAQAATAEQIAQKIEAEPVPLQGVDDYRGRLWRTGYRAAQVDLAALARSVPELKETKNG